MRTGYNGGARRIWTTVVVCAALSPAALLACPPTEGASEGDKPQQAPAPEAPPAAAKPVANVAVQQIKDKQALERDLRKIRAKYFGQIRNKEIRQIGLDKLRQYTDAQCYPSLVSIFAHEAEDVRTALLDMFAEQKTDEGDATIAWEAVHGSEPWYRKAATERLNKRYAQSSGKVPNMVKWVVAGGLQSHSDDEAGNAAELAAGLKLYEAIPMMINAQVQGAGGGDLALDQGGPPGPAIADIIVGKQVAFVADLTPVVGDAAVGFDPTLGVVTEGTVLRILGASVITYRTEIHTALVGLANSGWDGRSTASLGWDNAAWRSWYANEFQPYRAKVEGQASASPAAQPATPPAKP